MKDFKKQERKDTSVQQERAVLVGLLLPGDEPSSSRYDPLAELTSLTGAAGAAVVGRMVQKRRAPSAGTYIGSGKLLELREYAESKQAQVIIFDNDLSPSQIREIEQATNIRVIDRTELILDIFASRAQTHAARLQVELAQLEYTAPRLRGMWTHLERIAGAGGGTGVGAVGGVGTRGPGERQIEIDRRIVQRRVSFLKDQIAQLDQRRIREVKSRHDCFTVSLVGYTNAGKSTLMNVLTGAETYVADKLFATLDTKTRKWDLGGGQWALLSDTVGFVRNLPHSLVASFRATLEEAIHSDLLLHVVDASSPDAIGQIKAVETVLAELGCQDIPTIIVLNKVDAIDESSAIHVLRVRLKDIVEISAATGQGIDQLQHRVMDAMRNRYMRLTLETEVSNGKILAYIAQHGQILGRNYFDGVVHIDLRLPTPEIQRVLNMGGRIVNSEPPPTPEQSEILPIRRDR